jgi:lipid II:glycine glycyltransferase (peptidoglycan interpeptide bridge formation enzyme)
MNASWISKPLSRLTDEDRLLWQKTDFQNLPLSQSLDWGHSVLSTGAQCILVFSPERKVSALFMIHAQKAECVNGPVLDWNSISSAQALNEQISMTVHALMKSTPGLTEIQLKPRLGTNEFEFLSRNLAFPIELTQEAATMLLQLETNEKAQWDSLPSKIRHEINRAQNESIQIQSRPGHENLESFWEKASEFHHSKGLFIPDFSWANTLTKSKIDSVSTIHSALHPGSGSISECLVLRHRKHAVYLYAYEIRNAGLPNISMNALLQWEAMKNCIQEGCQVYDLNGISILSDPEGDNFSGVDQYKRKYKGEVVHYHSPLIRFTLE